MAQSSFPYQPLEENDSIRLLYLQPSEKHDADLHGSLVHTTIHERSYDLHTPFTALSYVWGDPTITSFIYIDDHHVTITASLAAALRDIRDSSLVFRIWADALCIDQNNIPERNQQVKQMGSIYQAAGHTIIHLGLLTSEAELVLLKARSRHVLKGETEEIIQLTKQAEVGILLRPWFTRAWILQELVLSRDPWVQCGKLRVRWTDLCALLLGQQEGLESAGMALKVLKDMDSARSRGAENSLYDILRARRGFGASDKRDIVYALLGLIKQDKAFSPELVDYSMSLSRVYTIVAELILRSPLQQEWTETVLSHADDGRELQDRPDGLPSWAPDWSVLPSYKAQFPKQMIPEEYTSCWAGIPFHCIDNPPTLLTLGSHFDTIEVVSPAFQWTPAIIQQLERTVKTFELRDLELEVRKLFEELKGLDKAGVQHSSFELFLSRFMSPFLRMYDVLEFLKHVGTAMEGRRLALTEKGCIVVVPSCTRPGDECVYFAGFRPFIVRNTPKQQPQHSNGLIQSAWLFLILNMGIQPDGIWDAKTPAIEYRRLIGACYNFQDFFSDPQKIGFLRHFAINLTLLLPFGIY
ncbi:HET-domain-containing protein [Hyaloscypha variabilis F]|uniref:HET-domain-containing protein n=1 Tax=Hyaloscypha variabilis (strain UAMH 11265 / GT02V1 / F) TaxID=1149755 RepID=A0A2J6R6V6_HYAVF|nr:HET-domain-containing protein [Hyaloscypha variabilis F]